MEMIINEKQIQNVTALDAEARYRHFIGVISDWEEVWGLFDNGWALASTDEERTVFPLWPAKEYATLCAVNEWHGYKEKSFSLDEMLDELLPSLQTDNILLGIFYTVKNRGVIQDVSQFINDLEEELEKY